MKEHDVTWLMMLGVCLTISWVGAWLAWTFPSFATVSPIIFGTYFSGMSLVGCLLGWLVNLRYRKDGV